MKTPRILIIGGTPETVELCGRLLDKENDRYILMAVDHEHTDRAVSIAEAFNPDIILILAICWMIPLDGLEVCRRLRSNTAIGHAKIILSSANKGFKGEARSCGADAFLPKPFYPEKLCGLIAKLLTYK